MSGPPKRPPAPLMSPPPHMHGPTPVTTSTPLSDSKQEPNMERKAYTDKDLLRLLAYMEAELQARDIALAVAKTEKAKAILYKRTPNDQTAKTMENLTRDDAYQPRTSTDDASLTQLFQLPIKQVRELAIKQNDAREQLEMQLNETHERHAAEVSALKQRLEDATRPKSESESHVVKIMEKHLEAVKIEATRKQSEIDRLDAELEKRDKDLEAERERTKVIVMYMLHERKQLLSQLHQLRMRVRAAGPQADDQETVLVAELRKQVAQASDERDHLSRVCSEQQAEKAVLVHIIRGLEDELQQAATGPKPGTMPLAPRMNGQHKANDSSAAKTLPGYVMVNKSAVLAASEAQAAAKYPPNTAPSPPHAANYTGTVVRRNSPVKYRPIHQSATFPTHAQAPPAPLRAPSPTKQLHQKAPLNNNVNGSSSPRYNPLPNPSSLPRPGVSMGARAGPAAPQSRPMPRQSRPAMGVSAQDYAQNNSTAIPAESAQKRIAQGLVQRLMKRSTSLPKKINGVESVPDPPTIKVLPKPVLTSPPQPLATTVRKAPPIPPSHYAQPQRHPNRAYDNVKQGQTHIS